MAKKTLLFSNTVGDVMQNDANIRFNASMEEYLVENIASNSKLIFIDAPGLGGENNYLPNILKCFTKIGIKFADVIRLDYDTTKDAANAASKLDDEKTYFLMGGNPLTQMEIIEKLNLIDAIRKYDGLVIGFCAGAINLSKYSIITSDEDFNKPQSYNGINRVPIIVEPHYNNNNDEERNAEIKEFAKKYNETIYAIPDESIIIMEDDDLKEVGTIYHFQPVSLQTDKLG